MQQDRIIWLTFLKINVVSYSVIAVNYQVMRAYERDKTIRQTVKKANNYKINVDLIRYLALTLYVR